MKKVTKLFVFLMLAFVMTLSFAACDGSTPTRYGFGETATLNDLEYTVQDACEYTTLSTPGMITSSTHSESGLKWIAVTIKVKNTKSSFSATVSSSDFKLVAASKQYSVDTGSHTYYINGSGADSITGKEKLCYTNSIISVDSSVTKEIIMYFKLPDDASLTDAYLSLKWAFDEVEMLIGDVAEGTIDPIAQVAFGDTATLNDMEYTVQAATTETVLSTPDMLTETTHSEAGAKWVAVTIKAKNTKTSLSQSVLASNIKLIIGDVEYDVDTDVYTWYIDGNGADSIVGKEKMCYTNSSVSIGATFSKSVIMFFKVPADTDLSAAYLNITWAFDGIQMLITQ